MKLPRKSILLLCLCWFFAQCANCPAQEKASTPKVGELAPPLILRSLLQGPATNEVNWEKLRGRVVVVEFWGTRCAPCIEAIPHLNELVAQFSQKPVVFISISEENGEYIKQFLHKTSMAGWIAEDGPLSPTTKGFGITGIPTTFIVDAKGKIAAVTHPSKLKAEHLEEVLAGKPCSLPQPVDEPDEPAAVKSKPKPDLEPSVKVVEASITGPFPMPGGAFNFCRWDKTHSVFKAEKAYLRQALAVYYDIDPKLVLEKTKLPEELYDISVAAPPGHMSEATAELAKALRTTFGITAQTNTQAQEVYVMKMVSTNAPGLRPTNKPGGGGQEPGGFKFGGLYMKTVCRHLTLALNKQVIDETSMINRVSVQIKWELSEAEKLDFRLDRRIGMLMDKNPKSIINDTLPAELKKVISPEDLKLLKAELMKPEDERFQPDPDKVIQAAREQLGLELKTDVRAMPTLEIRKAEARVE
ncbi:TlpA family protein disulfide reductase [Pedosphaera parvula]|uniref:Redoxin domain protein n=1 Tax=Pedosphaera parvula (strain Ellin514) TaxID=320771 RepID=B9XEF1_PEDPL|nr:TlpA disulfide reductase family protein [Pedosphaera parvula]EEF61665.1 Redoxin domain protein [Pedosphaera parvula Ellin514]